MLAPANHDDVMPSSPTIRDVVIVGSGPAGYTAAIYAARAGLDTVVVEGSSLGGALRTAGNVENYPGFAVPVPGPSLVAAMRGQARRFGGQLRSGDVDSFDLRDDVKTIALQDTRLHARCVILAMGSVSRQLDVPGERELMGRGVGTNAKRDGAEFAGRDVAVVGGGDAAAEEALFLATVARNVWLIHSRRRPRASGASAARLRALENVTILNTARVLRVLGDDHVTGLRVENMITGTAHTLAVDGVFIAIGHHPCSNALKGSVDVDARGFVTTRPGTTHTSVDGVFAAGDLIDRRYRQAITAAASGCAAALDAQRWLATTETVAVQYF